MKKHIWALLALLLASVLMLSACNDDKKDKDEKPDDDGTTESTDGGADSTACSKHTFGDWSVSVEATCTEDGVGIRTCSTCGETETQPIATMGHVFGDWSTIEPTCTQNGKRIRTCTECNTETEETVLFRHGHAFDENLVCKTCATQGTASEGLEYEYDSEIGGYVLTGIGTCTDTEIVVPTVYNGSPVRKIAHWAFSNCTQLTGITVVEGIRSIGKAFYGCSNLEYLSLPSTLEFLSSDDEAFRACNKLIEVEDGITYVDNWAVYATFTEWSEELHDYVENSTLNVREGTVGIASYAFSYGFQNLSTAMTVNLPDSLLYINDYAFSGCSKLQEIDLPDGLLHIGEYAFLECGLRTVTLPGSLTSVANCAFSNCDSLLQVTVEDGASGFPSSYVFPYCEKLTELYLLSQSSHLPISDVNSFKVVHTSIDTPTCIWETTDGIVFYENGDDCRLIDYRGAEANPSLPADCNGKTYVINDRAFLGKSTLTGITISNGVTAIGDHAFNGCRNLTSITISDSVTSIGSSAFSGCTGLTSITISDSVTSIGSSAFSGCTSLTSITIPDSVTSIAQDVFEGCDQLIQTEGGVSYVDKWIVDCDESVTAVSLRADTVGIGAYAFSACTALTSITIPDGVTSIGIWAFSDCDSLTSITIPGGVTSIGTYAFLSCDSLTSITISEGVTSISRDAFSSCNSLTSIIIPTSVTSIGARAFSFTALASIFYGGTSADWSAITIENQHTDLDNTTIYFYSENEPTDGNCWHYVDGVPTAW